MFIDAEIAKILDTKQIALKRFQDTLKLVEELRKRVHETEKQVELKHRLEEAELSDMSANVERLAFFVFFVSVTFLHMLDILIHWKNPKISQ